MEPYAEKIKPIYNKERISLSQALWTERILDPSS